MPTHTDDRLLWLLKGFGLASAYLTIPSQLERIRKLTEIKEKPKYEDETPSKTEPGDALRVNSLKTLADGHSYEQKSAAVKLVAIRSTKQETWSLLLRDLGGQDVEARNKAIRAIHERHCDIVEIFKTWWQDDPVMAEIVSCISHTSKGKSHLRNAGLMAPHRREGMDANDNESIDADYSSIASSVDDDGDILMRNGADTAGVGRLRVLSRTSSVTRHSARPPRPRNSLARNSAAEQALRRRRREAVVVSDGNAPLGRENIIEPLRDSPRNEEPLRPARSTPTEQQQASETAAENRNATEQPPLDRGPESVWAGLEGLRTVMGEGELEVDPDEDETTASTSPPSPPPQNPFEPNNSNTGRQQRSRAPSTSSVGSPHDRRAVEEIFESFFRRPVELDTGVSRSREEEELMRRFLRPREMRNRAESVGWVDWMRERWFWGMGD
ncbi:MAG: hypothetical protein Q9227_003652 [Pyrenula ochraceoflavens]